jgi:BolA family transcriptional regulator, general stress-responsive regulator
MNSPASICPTDRIARIESALRRAMQVTALDIIDDSHLHAGHAGARDGRGHFRVRIESDAFAGLRAVARHQLVYRALGDLMQTDIHALGIEALTPAEAQALFNSSNSETRQ